MPSQEDYFDKLLKELPEEEDSDAREGDADEERDTLDDFLDDLPGDDSRSADLDMVSGLSEEDIAARLSAAAQNAEGQGGERQDLPPEDNLSGDVLDIPEGAGDSEVREIQDLLKKSDRNEAIDSRADHMGDEDSPVEKLLADIEKGETEAGEAPVNRKEMKALEKKRLKEEKAAAKKAAKEAAKAKKEEKRRQKKRRGAAQEPEEISGQKDGAGIEEYDLLADKDLLDSIVSGAEHLEEEADGAAGSGRPLMPDEDTESYQEAQPDSPEEAAPDIIALDMDEIDNYLPDVSKEVPEKEEAQKKGLMSKFVSFLMEEDEEPENEDVRMSEENQEILDELDREQAGKNKKPKKAKKKKEKKKKEQKPKKVKPPKPKKEKKPKEPEEYLPGRRLTFKKMLPIFLLGATVGAVVFIFVNLSVGYTIKREAEAAFEAGDYQTCYLKLFGRKLNEEEAAMLGKSECILHMRMRYQEYLAVAKEGSDAEILDSLIQIVNDYPALYEYALQYNAAPEIYEIYTGILNILNERYGVTEEQARAIAAIDGNITYTKAIYAVVEGRGYGADTVPDAQLPQNPTDDILQPGESDISGEVSDLLPEESEIGSGDFMDSGSGEL